MTTQPRELVAYVGPAAPNGCGIDRMAGRSYPLMTWQGDVIGRATLGASWPVRSWRGPRMYQLYAIVDGREYTGRGFGVGMAVRLRETAQSRKTACT